MRSTLSLCAICGHVRRRENGWFLLMEDHWHDRLKILKWNDILAQQGGVRCACGTMHVRELVAHWMAAGSLDYPFASASAFELWINKCLDRDLGCEPPIAKVRGQVIGELAIHRESLRRALRDGSQSLSATLDALLRALETSGEVMHEICAESGLELVPS